MFHGFARRIAAITFVAFAASTAIAQVDLDAILVQLPSKDRALSNWAFSTLAENVSQNTAQLAARLKPAGDNTDQPERYALGGLSTHVTRPGAPPLEAAEFNAAITAALPGAPDDDARAFLMQLLHLTGDDACVPALAGYLGNSRLAPDARLALEAIGTEAASQALAAGAPAPADYPHNTEVITPPPAAEAFQARLDSAEGNAKWAVLAEGLESEFTSTRQVALAISAKEFPGNINTKRIARIAKKAPVVLRPEYLTVIGKRGGEAAVDALADYVNDRDELTRKAAVSALVNMNTPEADKVVQTWLEEAAPGPDTTAACQLLETLPGKERFLGTADADGFVSIFNGSDLSGWTGWKRGYVVEDGAIVCKDASLNLYTKREYANFAFRFEFKLTPAANNGVGIRVPIKGHASEDGMEIQVLDEDHPDYKDIHDYQVHGSVYGLVPAKRGHLKPTGEWNEQEIRAEGSRITVVLNGQTIVDTDLAEVLKQPTLDGKEHPGARRAAGHIGFLGHGDTVYYRNLRVKTLN